MSAKANREYGVGFELSSAARSEGQRGAHHGRFWRDETPFTRANGQIRFHRPPAPARLNRVLHEDALLRREQAAQLGVEAVVGLAIERTPAEIFLSRPKRRTGG